MMNRKWIGAACAGAIAVCAAGATQAQSLFGSGKLLLTGGVSQVEGSAGGGLTPWAVIGGYETSDQIGGNVFTTGLTTQDYSLHSTGALVGLYDRLELSYARQTFDLRNVSTALGLGYGYRLNVNTFGAKLRLIGNAVLDQDEWWPEVSIGAQMKSNDRAALVEALGARSGKGTDYYVSATKLYLAQSLLLNVTLRETKANQFGILGFGGRSDADHAEVEGSAAYLLTPQVAVGAEYRQKPDDLAVAHEGAASDLFVAYAVTKNVSVTLASVDLGNIVTRKQSGFYASLQAGF
jgi:hypothetical protein